MDVGVQVLIGVKFRMMYIFLNEGLARVIEDLAVTGEAETIEDENKQQQNNSKEIQTGGANNGSAFPFFGFCCDYPCF